MKKILSVIFIVLVLYTKALYSQGCSDAGFCTMGTLKQQSTADTSYKHSVTLSFSYGIGEQKTTIVQIIPELEFHFFKNNSVQVKIPYTSITGNLGSNSGMGDLAISTTQILKQTETTKHNLTLGFKFPSGTADYGTVTSADSSLPFPMPYQVSLGTTDLIIGTSFQYKKWNLALGFQGVLSDHNKNAFLQSDWPGNAEAKKYFESNQLRRGNDALLRIERMFELKKISLSLGVLNIIHLQESSIVDSTDNRVDVKGSDGLTVNVTGSMRYEISKRILLNFSFGVPILVRDARPDGLTRKLVLASGLSIGFGK